MNKCIVFILQMGQLRCRRGGPGIQPRRGRPGLKSREWGVEEGTALTSWVLLGLPIVTQQVKNPTSICEAVGSIPGLAQWVKDPALPQAVVSQMRLRSGIAVAVV